MCDYQVLIVGGGPVGMALGIELGILGIKTLIIEKHNIPLQLPRAQMLNPRSVEFFNRWGIKEDLIHRKLLSPNFPIKATWCSGLDGTLYAEVDIAENVKPQLSPEKVYMIN